MNRTLLPVLIGCTAGYASAASAEPRNFDGTWNVQLVTEAGLCDSAYSYAVAIRNGQVRPASSSSSASIAGRVSPRGAVGLSIQQGPVSGAASGRLGASSGSGSWRVASMCSGRWTALRQTTVTAHAL